jgi:hypothetical protein
MKAMYGERSNHRLEVGQEQSSREFAALPYVQPQSQCEQPVPVTSLCGLRKRTLSIYL